MKNYPTKCKLEQVVKHLKKDVSVYKKEAAEDKALMRKLKSPKKKHGVKKVAVKKKHVLKKKSAGKGKIEKVMREFKEGSLHSGSKKGPVVSNRKQAVAIALSEARKKGVKIPLKKKK